MKTLTSFRLCAFALKIFCMVTANFEIPGADWLSRLEKSGEVQHDKDGDQVRRDENQGQLCHRARGDVPSEPTEEAGT